MQILLADTGIHYYGARIMEDKISLNWYMADPKDLTFIDIYGVMRIDFMPFEGNA